MGFRTLVGTSTDTTYGDALIEEGYAMSNMDNCLFYKIITEEETTFDASANLTSTISW